mmetsp:Transcript_34086/g.95865  ORF Transcript_34086/g.95865 Transcript_34086/m.95865 type:complete len:624 (-) Transcript_34086:358-2229(-)
MRARRLLREAGAATLPLVRANAVKHALRVGLVLMLGLLLLLHRAVQLCGGGRRVVVAHRLHLPEGPLVGELHCWHEELHHVGSLLGFVVRAALHHLDDGALRRVRLPDGVQLPDGPWAHEERLEQLPEEVVVGIAGGVHAVFQHADEAGLDALADHGLVPVPRELLGPVASLVVLGHDLGHAALRPEVLVLGADDVERGDVELAPQLPRLRRRREVAVLHAEGVDEAPDDHLPVALVVEAADRHRPLRGAADEEALGLDEERQVVDDEVHLAAPELVALLVELAVVLRLLKDLVRLRRVRGGAGGPRGVDQVSGPVVDVVVGQVERQEVFVPQLAHGRVLRVREVVRGDDEHAHIAEHAADPHVVPAAAAGAMAVNQRGPDVAETEPLQEGEAKTAPVGRAPPPRLQLHQASLQHRVPQLLRQRLLGLLRKAALLGQDGVDPSPVLHAEQGPQLPDPAEPELLRGVALVVHVGLQPELDHRHLRQVEVRVVHQRRLRGRVPGGAVADDRDVARLRRRCGGRGHGHLRGCREVLGGGRTAPGGRPRLARDELRVKLDEVRVHLQQVVVGLQQLQVLLVRPRRARGRGLAGRQGRRLHLQGLRRLLGVRHGGVVRQHRGPPEVPG